VLEPGEAQAWIRADPRNAGVLFPYLNGKDLNSGPNCSPSRWVIDFADRNEDEAASFDKPYCRVYELVRPERLKNKLPARRDRWWQFAGLARGLRRAVAGLTEVIVIAQTSATQIPVVVSANQIFDQKLVVFASNDSDLLALLTSSIHRLWATRWGSTRTGDPVYTPSDVFETFPRPVPTERLTRAGRTLDRERREIMLRRRLGLTKLYNLVKDPELADGDDQDVARLRQIHVELDEAVMAAYGWEDVPLEQG